MNRSAPPLARLAHAASLLWHDRTLLLALAALALLLAGLAAASAPTLEGAPLPDVPSERLVVADLRGHALVVLDAAPPEEARRIALPGGPHELALLSDGRVAVSLEQYGRVAVVDLASGAVEVLETGGVPHGVAIAADLAGDVLLVTDRAIDAVRGFRIDASGDASTWAELAPVGVGRWPHAVALLPGGGLVVANALDDTLTFEGAPAGGRTVAASALPETVAVAPDGRVATAGAMGGAVEVFAPHGGRLLEVYTGGRPVRVAFSPDGATIAAALSAAGAVALVDASTGAVRRVDVGPRGETVPDGLAFSADGRRLYAGDVYGGRVAVVDVASARLLGTFEAGTSAGAILVLPR